MSRNVVRGCALVLCALVVGALVGPGYADEINWTNNESGIWGADSHWDPAQFPGPSDDARHTTKLNHIQVEADHSCLSFEGGLGSLDRFLLIEAGNLLTVEEDLFQSGLGGANVNFRVRFEDGSSGDLTTLHVKGIDDTNKDNLRDVELGPAAGHSADATTVATSSAGDVTGPS